MTNSLEAKTDIPENSVSKKLALLPANLFTWEELLLLLEIINIQFTAALRNIPTSPKVMLNDKIWAYFFLENVNNMIEIKKTFC